MNELKLVRRIQEQVRPARSAGLVMGIGDDCAIFRPTSSTRELVFTTDMMVEDVHFLRGLETPAGIGRKALARGLSDIAAMGAKPLFALVSLALAKWNTTKWVDGFYKGFLKLGEETGVTLAGGDLSRSEKFTCDVVVCGAVPRGEALRRDGAQPGDGIYVSGVLGGAAVGLQTRKGPGWRRHTHPEPRLALGRYLRTKAWSTAAMDISDGLSLDLHRLCVASGVGATIDRPLPIFEGATLDDALHGGEDYELLFTVSAGAKVPARYRGLPLTRVGSVRPAAAGEIDIFGWKAKPAGWDHFRES